jgi:hypothetical protein
VGIKVATWQKVITVVGDRVWRVGMRIRVEGPQSFTVMPISYENAFGGVDNFHPDSGRHGVYAPNPVGVGYHKVLDRAYVDGTPLPNTEETRAPVVRPDGRYRPMAFGPLGRNWLPRYKLAGTYDQEWIEKTFPFLPADFDPLFFQSAPTDQQVDHIVGGEPVILLNLTPDGRCSFCLPTGEIAVTFMLRNYQRREVKGVLDTLAFDPDAGQFSMVWRASLRLERNVFDVVQAVVRQTPSVL